MGLFIPDLWVLCCVIICIYFHYVNLLVTKPSKHRLSVRIVSIKCTGIWMVWRSASWLQVGRLFHSANLTFFLHRNFALAACGGQFYGDSGEVLSPNYPGRYPASSNCKYTIIRSSPGDTRLQFLVFQMSSRSCRRNKLQVGKRFWFIWTYSKGTTVVQSTMCAKDGKIHTYDILFIYYQCLNKFVSI